MAIYQFRWLIIVFYSGLNNICNLSSDGVITLIFK